MAALLLRSCAPILLGGLLSACATTDEQPPAPAREAPSPPPSPQADEDDEPAPPRTWEEARQRFEFKCPAPAFALDEPRRIGAGGVSFLIEGSRARREGEAAGPLVLGVLGALKDASAETRANVKRAARLFAAEKVTVVVANGDLGEDRELDEVFAMLGEELQVPVLLHSGNMEWTGAFVRAMSASEDAGHALVNLNWVSHVELGGGVHLLSLPGYHDLHFLKPGACRYLDEDLARLSALAKELSARGDVVLLTSHGPPRQEGAGGLDVAYDDAGNVGDPRITQLLEDGAVKVGLFSHILESGGRATRDPKGKEPVTLPLTAPSPSLYVNAGSASAFPWKLHGGKTSEGMALVVTIAPEGIRAKKLELR